MKLYTGIQLHRSGNKFAYRYFSECLAHPFCKVLILYARLSTSLLLVLTHTGGNVCGHFLAA